MNLPQSLGLYLSAPFCRSKCSYCNFASQVYAPGVYAEYCELLAREVTLAAASDGLQAATLESIYWGGGTPTLLPKSGWEAIMAAVRSAFALAPEVEHTAEAAPGTLDAERLKTLRAAGVNRLSLGAQSFEDAELRAVGRLHRGAMIGEDIARARAAGISNISLDLIAGLPHQTTDSWQHSVRSAMATEVPHLSLYMLEVDEDSRLGNELLAGGVRYHAHAVPDEDLIADAYEWACAALEREGWEQYEISNFARPGFASRHNLGYWRRRPYLGCGLDAHSLLLAPEPRRFANPDTLDAYCAPLRQGRLPRQVPVRLTPTAEREEHYFLGLRCNQGVEVGEQDPQQAAVAPLVADGLLTRDGSRIALTARGRMVANRVLVSFLEPG
ncbi:MAG: radical SAM family heme chaperone HemW [Terriglobales bacterium]